MAPTTRWRSIRGLRCSTHCASAESPARIINLGSIGGLHIPNWEAHPYGASKAAVHHLTRSLAKRFVPEHILVNAIAPGPFHSRQTDTRTDAVKKSVQTYIPAGRPGTPAPSSSFPSHGFLMNSKVV